MKIKNHIQIEKLDTDPDPNPHQNEKSDPDQLQKVRRSDPVPDPRL